MANGLPRVFATQEEKPHREIGQDVFHETLAPKVFGLECADNRYTIRRAVFEARGERRAVQRAHRRTTDVCQPGRGVW